jgi:hypothetical protein
VSASARCTSRRRDVVSRARTTASVELGRSNVLGALWWNARQLVRTDLLL